MQVCLSDCDVGLLQVSSQIVIVTTMPMNEAGKKMDGRLERIHA